ncbi:NADH-quinone oxidoreductase subunit K [Thermofilum pendens]|uniref:NADH-ubiquinone oxidoreductase, chain 4L n=1 Tax=Thermofilum pendens (strain DSM 2475 / Hrk 5) TaxID=368408 RepID=A1RZ44_THEPD|nr:NADH-quinone oxidoreductase subunit K [Thermofilum pendens]ABL78474.1 NADH-ubiquinone oxidoreductase, chain 4L [Thermofilum pendens Hrk 5]
MPESIVLLGVGGLLVIAGATSVAATRNLVKVAMGLQAMILGSLLILSTAVGSSPTPSVDPVLLVVAAAGASEVVSISVLYLAWSRHRTIDPHRISELKG